MKSTFITFALLFVAFVVSAQTSTRPFSFQGYAIDPDGKALAATSITAKFTVYDTGGSGATYTEEQIMSSDAFGVFTALIGSGSPNDFKKLNFTADNASFRLKVEVKKTVGGTYTTIHDATMAAVPYARHADNGVPVGTIVPFAGPKTRIPAGWLLCDGASYNGANAEYAQLYAVIGIAWGTSGGTNFNVPDLRGLFLRGVDEGAGNDPDAANRIAMKPGGAIGDKVGTKQLDINKSHNHPHTIAENGQHVHNLWHPNQLSEEQGWPATGFLGVWSTDRQGNFGSGAMFESGLHSHDVEIQNSGGNESRPKNAAVYYIIKY
jgi:microcystin-dependent protein